jgi:hypothetical protein
MPCVQSGKIIKCNFFFFYLILICLNSNGQIFTETYNNLLKHFQDTVVSLTSCNNSIIQGIDNKIFVNTAFFAGKSNIHIDKEYILSREGNYFLLHSTSVDSKKNIELLILNQNDDTLYYKIFNTEGLPAVSIYAGHVNLSTAKNIRLEDLQMADSIFLLFSHTFAGSYNWLKIKRFTIGYRYGSYYITQDNNGNTFTQKTRKFLFGLKHGQEVSLNITAEGIGSLKKDIPILYFYTQ